MGQHEAFIQIEDPFDPTDNVGRSVTEITVKVCVRERHERGGWGWSSDCLRRVVNLAQHTS